MIQETQAREPGTHAGIFLREERFDLIMRILGHRSRTAAARALGIDPKTIYLAASRGVRSDQFIAETLAAMKEHEAELAELGITPAFEEVFTVADRRAA